MARRPEEPPEILRRLSKGTPKRPFGLQLIPEGLCGALSSIPMPWELQRRVKVVFYFDGSVSVIKSRKRFSVGKFNERWNIIGSLRPGKVVLNAHKANSRIGGVVEEPQQLPITQEEESSFGVRGPTSISALGTCYSSLSKSERRKACSCLLHSSISSTKLNRQRRTQKNICESLREYLYGDQLEERHPECIAVDSHVARKNMTRRLKKKRRSITRNKNRAVKSVLSSPFFYHTTMDWDEAVGIFLRQAANIIRRVLYVKKLSYVSLDTHFNISYTREPTTKERKKSRLGVSIRLICDLLKLLKYVHDAHSDAKRGAINCLDLCATLRYIFKNVGTLTGMYRHRYKLKKSIIRCRRIWASRNLWIVYWQVWCSTIRGYVPLLQTYARNLVDRLINGRKIRSKPLTKQRRESALDLEIKELISEKYGRNARLLQHFNEMWRCWKADIPYYHAGDDCVENLGVAIEHSDGNLPVILADHGSKRLYSSQGTIETGDRCKRKKVDNDDAKGRVLQASKANFVPENEPVETRDICPTIATTNRAIQEMLEPFCRMKADWYLKSVSEARPKTKSEMRKYRGRFLRLYVKNERFRQSSYLENPFIDVKDAIKLYRITARYVRERNIRKIELPELSDAYILRRAVRKLKREVSKKDRVFYDAIDFETYYTRVRRDIISKRNFMPLKLEFNDRSPLMPTIAVSTIIHRADLAENLVDSFLESYLWERSRSSGLFPEYVDSSYRHPFEAIAALADTLPTNNVFLCHLVFENVTENADLNLLRSLLRLVLSPVLVDYIISRYNCRIRHKDMEISNAVGLIREIPLTSFLHAFLLHALCLEYISGYEIKCQYGTDIFISVESFSEVPRILSSVPSSLGYLKLKNISRYPFQFDLGGFLVKQKKTTEGHSHSHEGAVEKRVSVRFGPGDCKKIRVKRRDREPCVTICGRTSCFRVTADPASIHRFNKKTRSIARRANGSSFIKIAGLWNGLLLEYVGYYRETAVIRKIKKAETLIKRAIMMSTNSKAPSRFPQQIFHSPMRLGGLGLIGIGESKATRNLRPAFVRWREQVFAKNRLSLDCRNGQSGTYVSLAFLYSANESRDHFKDGDGKEKGKETTPRELLNNDGRKRQTRNTFVLSYEFANAKSSHRLYKQAEYDSVDLFGSSRDILDLTLFRASGISSEEDVGKLWEVPSFRHGTKAQVTRRYIVPNRRFILWWSPSLNCSSVYLGYETKIDLTGIRMFGKLCGLKILFVQIFREKLWKKIYERLRVIIASVFTGSRAVIDKVSKKRCYGENGGHDILLEGEFNCFCRSSSESEFRIDHFLTAPVREVKVNLQVVWCSVDERDLSKKGSEYYNNYLQDDQSHYLLVMIDLCFGTWYVTGYCSEEVLSSLKDSLNDFFVSEDLYLILRSRLCSALSIDLENTGLTDVEIYTCGYVCEIKDGKALILNTKTGYLYFLNTDVTYEDDPIVISSVHDFISKIVVKSVALPLAVYRKLLHFKKSDLHRANSTTFREASDNEMKGDHLREGGVCIRFYSSPLHLFEIFRLSKDPLKAKQNVYFRNTTSYTSFFRLRLLLRASYGNNRKLRLCNVSYNNGEWTNMSEREWVNVERAISEKECAGDVSLKDSESIWVEDFIEANENIRTGNIARHIEKGKDSRFIPHGLLASAFDPLNTRKYPAEANLNRAEYASPVIQLPKNVLLQFRILSNTRFPVRAYITRQEPFTVVILPQYLTRSAVPEHFVGIISNKAIEFRCKLEVIVNQAIEVRGWSNTSYVQLDYAIVETPGIFISSDWNYNFRIPEFSLNYVCKEETPMLFYDRRARERHFSEYYEEIVRRGKNEEETKE